MYITLTPAYGRDYKTAAQARAAWNNNTDFIIQTYGHPGDGRPANKQSFADATDSLSLRFCNKRKTTNI